MVILPFWSLRAPHVTSIQVLEQSVIDRAMERDAPAAKAEYLAEFRTDIEALLTQEAVTACIDSGILERPFNRQNNYVAFVDPSGGSSDAMTMCIAHKEGATVVVDVIREYKPPFSPEAVVAEYADLVRKYRCLQAYGDRYAGEWVVEQFRKHSVHYEASERTKVGALSRRPTAHQQSRSCSIRA